MRTSESTNQLTSALSKAQSEFPKILKDTENPFFKSKYADLAAIVNSVQDALGKQGLAITQHLETDFQTYADNDGTVRGERLLLCVITRLIHISGEFEESTLRVPLLDAKPQTLGSASTYVRRYALQSILRVAAETDDDGDAASRFTPKEKEQYIKDKRAKLQQDVDKQVATAKEKAETTKQLEASLADLDKPPQPVTPDATGRFPKDEGLLSDAQRKMIWVIVQKRGISDGDLHEVLGSLGYESLTELPKSQVTALLDEIDPEYKYHARSRQTQ